MRAGSLPEGSSTAIMRTAGARLDRLRPGKGYPYPPLSDVAGRAGRRPVSTHDRISIGGFVSLGALVVALSGLMFLQIG